jgi:FKBP-type peptidyl-prolyl cis-trans isomerase
MNARPIQRTISKKMVKSYLIRSARYALGKMRSLRRSVLVPRASKVRFVEIVVGKGPSPEPGKTVQVHYIGG